MHDTNLQQMVSAFNVRNYQRAAEMAREGLLRAEGRSEALWMGLVDTCEGFWYLRQDELDKAEQKMTSAMQKLRNFGFRYENFEITSLLAGLRRCAAEIRAVRAQHKRRFDVSLLPQLRLSAKAEELLER